MHGWRGFLAWWRAGLMAWLPPRLRQALAGGNRLLLQVEDDRLRVQAASAGTLRELAVLPLPLEGEVDPLARLLREDVAEWPRWLLLPARRGLRRPLLLPAAARERLRDVLAFEIERQTPFAAGEALHDGRLLQVQEDGRLQVELVVLPRRDYQAALAQLGAAAVGLAGLDLVDAGGAPLGVNLLPPAQRQMPRDRWRSWNLALTAVALLALLLGLAQVLDNRRAAAARLQAEVARRAAQAQVVAAQRQRLLDAVEGGAWLRAQRNGRPSAVEVMDALAQRLPDGTYLEKLAIDGDQLTLIGLSNQAAALVGKLEGAPQWSAPALSGALQQDSRTRMDRFTLVAQLRRQAPPNGAPATPAGGAP
ncbi:PilN domain-containing protein [Thermomonas alba]|uniref:PilN domain-containing protein n=1 Tax=Thermomonas alba TaxID=2888525 RepID=UPI001F04A067